MPRRSPGGWAPGRLTRTLLAMTAGLMLAAGIAALGAIPARAAMTRPGPAADAASRRAGAGATAVSHAPPRLSVAITSVTPPYARPGATVTVSGTVVNPTAAPAAGLAVQLWASGTALGSVGDMNNYLLAAGPTGRDSAVGSPHPLGGPLAPRSSRPWTLTLRTGQLGFGVYPLAVQLSDISAANLSVARTFLPFWPSKTGAAGGVQPLRIGWVWPLIGTPSCQSVMPDGLAGDLAPGGRLNVLLAAGQSAAARAAQLTWAIDPGLVDEAAALRRPYREAGPRGPCPINGPSRAEPASTRAGPWLAGVKQVAAQQNFFATPYDDVDIAALAHQGAAAELSAAFVDARSAAARQFSGRSQRTTPALSGIIAWPADGLADLSVLEGLPAPHQVGTMILKDSLMPPSVSVNYAPGAVTSTGDGLGHKLHVLLADTGLANLLATPPSVVPGVEPPPSPVTPAQSPAATFSQQQWFLAETAMLVAEAPNIARSVVVAPPAQWAPPAALARALLTDTVSAPWLRPATLASLITHPVGGVSRGQLPPRRISSRELQHPLKRLDALHTEVGLLRAVLGRGAGSYLSPAFDAVESAAWRGDRGRKQAKSLLHQLETTVTHQFLQIRLTTPTTVTLGGNNGAVLVWVSNNLPLPITVEVKVKVPDDSTSVLIANPTQTVPLAAHARKPVKIQVRSLSSGSTQLTVFLATPQGTRLPFGKPLQTTSTVRLEATHFGTLAIILVAIALVIFVISASVRSIRRGADPATTSPRPGGGESPAGEVTPGEGNGGMSGSSSTAEPSGPDNVVPKGGDREPAKETDDQASAPGGPDRR